MASRLCTHVSSVMCAGRHLVPLTAFLLIQVLLCNADTTMPEYETLDDQCSQGSDCAEPASKPESAKVSGRAWGRLLKLCQLSTAAIFIVITEFFEKLSYFGIRAILVLYFTNALLLSESKATSLYHVFVFLSTFFTILGAFLSDFCFGRYRTILMLSILYLVGNIFVSVTAIPGQMGRYGMGAYMGLFLVTVGCGGIRSSMSPFGADQIVAKEEKRYRMYFSFFYFSMNLAALFAGIVIPILREDVQCFDSDCYSLAFGVPSLTMLLALVIFGLGTSRYKIYPPTGNLFCKVFCATGSAIKNKVKWCVSKKKDTAKEHWLDWADQKYEREIINDAKRLYSVLALYPLLPMYWALYEQQGSRWTLQAQEMDRNVGSIRLKPDQLQSLNVLFILILLPLFEGIIYPQFEKRNLLIQPVTRMTVGLVGAAVSFCITGIVQLQIQNWQVMPQPSDVTEFKIFNGAPCQYSFDFLENQVVMDPQTFSASYPVPIDPFTLHIVPINCSAPQLPLNISITTDSKTSKTLFMVRDSKTRELVVKQIPDNTLKILDNSALVRIFPVLETPAPSSNRTLRLTCKADAVQDLDVRPSVPSPYVPVELGRCSLQLSGFGPNFFRVEGEVDLKDGGVYTIALYQANNTKNVTMQLNIDHWPKTVSVLWQIPQYLIISMSEILFSVTGLHLAYTQAPSSMRSVVMAAWFLTIAMGNLIVVVIAECTLISNQAVEFFLFAALMGLVSLIFIATARLYKYHPIDTGDTALTESSKGNESDGLNSELKAPPPYMSEEHKTQPNS
ncbi:solute carrier family 15 member 2-like [Heptranchias perlo]|uniref:solute carrier family 15 member 2-like n=1 Tax=Heptranchias perlo TaxID=212740 RepID=UPI00355A21E1